MGDPLARRLRRLRRTRGLTQARLAARAGVSLGYVARLEIGRHDPKASTLRKLARALGVDAARLLD
jgi:transcriptional regulator with XRE-family HTH domain